MSDWGACHKCGGYGYLPHSCVEFEAAMDHGDGDPSWVTLFASDMELAAERFADRYDCGGDYLIIQAGESGDFLILVRKPDEPDTIKRFHIYGETVPQYHAREDVSFRALAQKEKNK